jgi:hypothetical protein
VNELGNIPRLVGSDGEIKGINYCKKIFKEINLDLNEEKSLNAFEVGLEVLFKEFLH